MRFKSTGAGASGSEYKPKTGGKSKQNTCSPSCINNSPEYCLITPFTCILTTPNRDDLNVKSHKKVSKYVTRYN